MPTKKTAVALGAAVLALSGAITSTVVATGHLPTLDRHAEGQGRRVRRSRPTARRPEPADQGLDQHRQGPQRHPVHRRRHGRLGDHRRPQLPRGRGRRLQGDRRPAADRPDDALQREQGRPGSRTTPPTRPSTGTAWATGVEDLRQRRLGSTAGQGVPDPARAGQEVRLRDRRRHRPRRSRTPPPPSRSATSASAPATAPRRPPTTCPEAAKENGGRGSISEQLLDTRPDVTLGGGSPTFAEVAKAGPWQGKTLEQQAKARGYNYITAKSALAGVTTADQAKPLLGLFSPGNMPVKFAPLPATAHGATLPAQSCKPEPTFSQVPDLRTMTSKSIDLLSHNLAGQKKGFFLQVESASIDKKDHAADPCGQIGETEQLDQAVQEALGSPRRTATRWSSSPPTTRTPARSSTATPPASPHASPPRRARR